MSIRPSVRAAFAGLIDYAGLFPPAALPIGPALAEFATVLEGPNAWMVRRFVVPASRLAQLAGAYSEQSPLPLTLILDVPSDALVWFEAVRASLAAAQAVLATDDRLQLAALEVPLPALRNLRDTYDGAIGQYAALASAARVRELPAYLEPVRDGRWRGALPATMTVLARHRLGAKIRCGGATADAFPSCEDLSAFVRAATAVNVPFKATAGLHHPVRHVDAASGFAMHGFVNLMAATLLARGDAPSIAVESALGEEDAGAFTFSDASFAWRDRHFDTAAVAAMRDAFVGYGSCSVDEPVADLRGLAVLDGAVA